MSIESEMEALATKLVDWATLDRTAAASAESEELKRYWLGRADGWEECSMHIRKALDANAPMPPAPLARILPFTLSHPANRR